MGRGKFGEIIQINLILAVLNMLPLPPLDGGRVAVGILPDALRTRLRGSKNSDCSF